MVNVKIIIYQLITIVQHVVITMVQRIVPGILQVHEQQEHQIEVMSDNLHELTPEQRALLDEKIKEFGTVEWVVKQTPDFDSFMDWLDIDIGLPMQTRLDTYLEVEKKFREAGYPERADLAKRKHDQLKTENH